MVPSQLPALTYSTIGNTLYFENALFVYVCVYLCKELINLKSIQHNNELI